MSVDLGKLSKQDIEMPFPATSPWDSDRTSSFSAVRDLILNLVGDKWLNAAKSKKLNHPLLLHWEICNDALSRGGGLTWKYEPKWLCEFMSMYFDAIYLLNSSGAKEGERVLGDFPHFGSKGKEVLARARAQKAESYLNLQSELFVFGWAVSAGSKIQPIAEDGMPDFLLELADQAQKIAVEVKQPSAADYKTLKKHVCKANSQLRKFGRSDAGILVIDLRSAIGPQALDLHGGTNKLVIDCVNTVNRLLGGAYKAISAFIVIWDETFVRRMRNETNVLKVLTRRNSILTRNKHAGVQIEGGDPLYEIGGVISVEFQSESYVPARLAFVRPDGALWLRYNAYGFACRVNLTESAHRQVLYK